MCQGLFFNKIAGLPKREPGTGVPVNFAKFLRTPPVAASEKVSDQLH